MQSYGIIMHAQIQKVLSEGSNFDIHEGREDPNTTISGPSLASQRNTIKWGLAGVRLVAQN